MCVYIYIYIYIMTYVFSYLYNYIIAQGLRPLAAAKLRQGGAALARRYL